ncbi:hypothetical protein LOTGIDRAFT_154063 [Lottia gigantea]|uniref:Uncharacterized protein n=1 Tax=Lottia gigantea TaxID=225164 RepID=V3ZD18_LOTGI|nr:hypothetical protein LOTGIDRAFT_154063 [Lottia gigantea]ESO88993.1 hypothetical protein LOTGIDRAFT_154063 [Lottia gigantea]
MHSILMIVLFIGLVGVSYPRYILSRFNPFQSSLDLIDFNFRDLFPPRPALDGFARNQLSSQLQQLLRSTENRNFQADPLRDILTPNEYRWMQPDYELQQLQSTEDRDNGNSVQATLDDMELNSSEDLISSEVQDLIAGLDKVLQLDRICFVCTVRAIRHCIERYCASNLRAA